MPGDPPSHLPQSDATVIQEGQRILIRRSNMTRLGSPDPDPLLGLRHGATSTGSW
jgi:hypothetical protein